MDLSKIKTLIDFVGRSNITELTVSEKDTTVRIFRAAVGVFPVANAETESVERVPPRETAGATRRTGIIVEAPIFGVLHNAPAPGEAPFVAVGDEVSEGQTLFIIEAMKVFNTVVAPQAGRIARLTDVNGTEVEPGEMLAEIG